MRLHQPKTLPLPCALWQAVWSTIQRHDPSHTDHRRQHACASQLCIACTPQAVPELCRHITICADACVQPAAELLGALQAGSDFRAKEIQHQHGRSLIRRCVQTIEGLPLASSQTAGAQLAATSPSAGVLRSAAGADCMVVLGTDNTSLSASLHSCAATVLICAQGFMWLLSRCAC